MPGNPLLPPALPLPPPGLREVTHEFGGRIPHGGGDRDSSSVGIRWAVIFVLLFLWLAVLVRVAIVLLLCTLVYIPSRTQGHTKPKYAPDTDVQFRHCFVTCTKYFDKGPM